MDTTCTRPGHTFQLISDHRYHSVARDRNRCERVPRNEDPRREEEEESDYEWMKEIEEVSTRL